MQDHKNDVDWLLALVIFVLLVALCVGNDTGLNADCETSPCYGHGYMFD